MFVYYSVTCPLLFESRFFFFKLKLFVIYPNCRISEYFLTFKKYWTITELWGNFWKKIILQVIRIKIYIYIYSCVEKFSIKPKKIFHIESVNHPSNNRWSEFSIFFYTHSSVAPQQSRLKLSSRHCPGSYLGGNNVVPCCP